MKTLLVLLTAVSICSAEVIMASDGLTPIKDSTGAFNPYYPAGIPIFEGSLLTPQSIRLKLGLPDKIDTLRETLVYTYKGLGVKCSFFNGAPFNGTLKMVELTRGSIIWFPGNLIIGKSKHHSDTTTIVNFKSSTEIEQEELDAWVDSTFGQVFEVKPLPKYNYIDDNFYNEVDLWGARVHLFYTKNKLAQVTIEVLDIWVLAIQKKAKLQCP